VYQHYVVCRPTVCKQGIPAMYVANQYPTVHHTFFIPSKINIYLWVWGNQKRDRNQFMHQRSYNELQKSLLYGIYCESFKIHKLLFLSIRFILGFFFIKVEIWDNLPVLNHFLLKRFCGPNIKSIIMRNTRAFLLFGGKKWLMNIIYYICIKIPCSSLCQ